MKGVGPGSYNPNADAIMKVSTAKPMLGKNDPVGNMREGTQAWPGPGHYTMPDGFTLNEVRQPASPSKSIKPVEDPGKITKAELEA